MYANVRQGMQQGAMTKHITPRFPRTGAELERLLGFPFVRAWTVQEAAASPNPVGIDPAATVLGVSGAVEWRKPVKGIQEYGCRSPSTSGYSVPYSLETTAICPNSDSFLMLYYGSFEGDGSNPNVGFMLLDNADGGQFVIVGPNDGNELVWLLRANDGINPKAMLFGSPRDRVARGVAFLYDAADGNLYGAITGEAPRSAPMGAWVGLTPANMVSPTFFIGCWPGVPGSDCTTRYTTWCSGPALNGQGPQLGAIMRRLGWL